MVFGKYQARGQGLEYEDDEEKRGGNFDKHIDTADGKRAKKMEEGIKRRCVGRGK